MCVHKDVRQGKDGSIRLANHDLRSGVNEFALNLYRLRNQIKGPAVLLLTPLPVGREQRRVSIPKLFCQLFRDFYLSFYQRALSHWKSPSTPAAPSTASIISADSASVQMS